MFFQFSVDEDYRNFFRFLWWKDEDVSSVPTKYRITVHVFGAVSSPGCANFGLKRAADDGEEEFGVDAADFVRSNFYVDEGLISIPTASEAIELVKNHERLLLESRNKTT